MCEQEVSVLQTVEKLRRSTSEGIQLHECSRISTVYIVNQSPIGHAATNQTSLSEMPDDRTTLIASVIAAGNALQARFDGALGNIKGITYSEYRLLGAIRASPNGSGSRVDLAKAVGLTPSGVTRALRPLEKLGMVETARHPRDARRSLATLTAQGDELLRDAEGVISDATNADAGVQALTAADAETLLALTKRLGG